MLQPYIIIARIIHYKGVIYMYLASDGIEAAVNALNPQNIARLEREARRERARLVSAATRGLLVRLRRAFTRTGTRPA